MPNCYRLFFGYPVAIFLSMYLELLFAKRVTKYSVLSAK